MAAIGVCGTAFPRQILAGTTSQRECALQLASVRRRTRVFAWHGFLVALRPKLCSDDSLSR